MSSHLSTSFFIQCFAFILNNIARYVHFTNRNTFARWKGWRQTPDGYSSINCFSFNKYNQNSLCWSFCFSFYRWVSLFCTHFTVCAACGIILFLHLFFVFCVFIFPVFFVFCISLFSQLRKEMLTVFETLYIWEHETNNQMNSCHSSSAFCWVSFVLYTYSHNRFVLLVRKKIHS